MKITTWNINSVRLRLELLEKLIEQQNPDIICLQETKVRDDLFPESDIKRLGYPWQIYSGQKSYNGVAILSKIPIDNSFALSFYNDDKRHLAVKVGGFELHNFYVPAGGDEPDIEINPKFKHKLEYLDLMKEWFVANRAGHGIDAKMILVGDLNIAPHEHDVWSSKQLRNVISHTDIERRMLLDLQHSLGFVDSARHFTPMEEKIYTWWSYRNLDWQKSNRGRRLDHIWVSANIKDRMKAIVVANHARSWTQPSDHVPYSLELHD